MKKLFLSNLVLVIGLNALIKPLYIFGIDRGVQNAVGASAYGLYFALFNFVYLFQILNDFGIQNFNHSVFSKYQSLIPKYLPKILATKLFLALLFALCTLFAALFIGFKDFIWPLLIIIIVNQVLASLVMYLRTTLSALGHYAKDSFLSIADKLFMIIGMGYLLWLAPVNEISILHFVLCQLTSYLLALSLAVIFVMRHDLIRSLNFQYDLIFMRALFKKSVPYALVLFLMTLYTRMDGVMLERLLPDGQKQAGIYAASYRILDAFSNVGLLFAGLLLPMFAKMIRNRQPVDDLTGIARNALLTFSLTLTAISFVYHDSIIFTLYHDADGEWSAVYQLLFVSYLGTSIAYIYGTLLTANESIRSMNLIFAAGVLLNLVLNFIFIMTWKAWGAALATLITQLATATALVVLAHRQIKLEVGLSNWIRLMTFAGLILACTYWSKLWPLPWFISVLVVGLASLPIAMSVRLLSFRSWQDITS